MRKELAKERKAEREITLMKQKRSIENRRS
jgi:hypothetical protein